MTPLIRRVAAALAAFAAVGVIVGLFLSLYASRHYAFPVGYDTPKYVWRANLVEAEGAQALDGSAQEPLHVNADRPGYPVLTALLHDASGIRPFDLTFVLPAVVAAAIGLAAGAFAVRVLGEPGWAFAVYAIAVGASVNVASIAIGYADTLLASAILLAAATTAVRGAGGERTIPASVVLLAGAATVHWNFAAMFVALLGGLAVVLIPESRRMRREGAGLLETPSGRLAAMAGGGVVAGGAALVLGPALPRGPSLGAPEFTEKIHRDVPDYRFAATGPAAAVGAASLYAGTDRTRLRGLALVLLWALTAAAAVALLALGAAVPAHRILAFAFGIPILVAAASVGIARLVADRSGRPGRVLGAAIVLGALAGTAFLGHRVLFRAVPWTNPQQFVQSATAGRYLESIGGNRPVVFVVDVPAKTNGAVNLPFRVIRSVLPGHQIRRTYVYLGDPDRLLAGRPSEMAGNPAFREISLEFLDGMRPVLRQNPIVIALRTFNRDFDALRDHARPGGSVSPDVLVIRGPTLSAAITEPPPPSPHSTGKLVGFAIVSLALLFGAGLGWSVTLVPGPALARTALAPAFGIATLALAGLLADRVGIGLHGGAGVAIVALTALLGWAPLLLQRFRAEREAPSEPPSPPG